MTVQTTILKDIAMVMLNITIWSGSKRMDQSDFINIDADDLPSTRVVSYGIKHLIDPERLSPFKKLRMRAERLCGRYGTRLLGGWAVPQDSIDILGQELSSLIAEFEKEIDSFMIEYDKAIEDWISSNPDFEGPLRKAVLPPETVRSRLRAGFSFFEISASPRDRTNSMESVGGDLYDSILNGLVSTIRPVLKGKSGSVEDSYRVTFRTTIRDLAGKMNRFGFVDPTGGLVNYAARLNAAVDGEGTIKGQEFLTLWNLIHELTSLDAARKVISQYAGSPDPLPYHTKTKQADTTPAFESHAFGFLPPEEAQTAKQPDEKAEEIDPSSVFDLPFPAFDEADGEPKGDPAMAEQDTLDSDWDAAFSFS